MARVWLVWCWRRCVGNFTAGSIRRSGVRTLDVNFEFKLSLRLGLFMVNVGIINRNAMQVLSVSSLRRISCVWVLWCENYARTAIKFSFVEILRDHFIRVYAESQNTNEWNYYSFPLLVSFLWFFWFFHDWWTYLSTSEENWQMRR